MPRLANQATTNSTKEEKDRLMEEHKPFILRTASFVLKRYVTESDDAWSVALIAFWEAADHYDLGKGEFEAYARLVIKRRLIDFQRKQKRFLPEINVSPEVFSGETDQDDPYAPAPFLLIRNRTVLEEDSLRDELADAAGMLAHYRFGFLDLVDCSPKSEKTKKACAEAAAFMLEMPELMNKMRRTRRLPVQAVAAGIHISFKVINRHRRYIIAVTEILDGDYPGLKTYLESVRKG